MRGKRVAGGLGWFGLLAAALVACALGAPAEALAANRDGVIVAVSTEERTFAVQSDGGDGAPVVTFRTDADTRITFERKAVPFGNLVPGDQVSVRYRNHDLGPLATAVEIHRLRPSR